MRVLLPPLLFYCFQQINFQTQPAAVLNNKNLHKKHTLYASGPRTEQQTGRISGQLVNLVQLLPGREPEIARRS